MLSQFQQVSGRFQMNKPPSRSSLQAPLTIASSCWHARSRPSSSMQHRPQALERRPLNAPCIPAPPKLVGEMPERERADHSAQQDRGEHGSEARRHDLAWWVAPVTLG